MPAPATVPAFLDLARRSGLVVPEAALDEVLDRYRTAGTFPQTIDAAAALLVRDGLLTFFQAKQLKLGRYKRFTIGSKYRLLELIGAGGMGAVYLCEHTLMRRLVALKVLPVDKLSDPSNLERFHREARAVAALDHPNIVRAYDIDQHEKLHFLVMEFVDGNSLQDIIARHGPMDPVRAAHYVAQAAVGLQHAHDLGMVHRDVKPGNLLLDRAGVIKILDMGLARFFAKPADSVTEKYDEKCVLGTADYLAPEQAVTNTVDIRADIYALGGTLYFMLTGQTPFPGGTIAAKLVAHQTKDPKGVEAFRQDVPPELLAVLRKMMAKDPDHRYQEPAEVAEALAPWADEPTDPPPAREMPGLCPLVLSLAVRPGDKTGSAAAVPLGRAIFGPGRGGRPGSSARHRVNGSGSGSVAAPADRPAVAAPISTARAAAARTATLPPRAAVVEAAEPARAPSREPARQAKRAARNGRSWLVAVAVVFGVLFFTAALAGAYFLGKDNRFDAPAAGSR